MMGALTLPILDGIPSASNLAIRRGGVPISAAVSAGTLVSRMNQTVPREIEPSVGSLH